MTKPINNLLFVVCASLLAGGVLLWLVLPQDTVLTVAARGDVASRPVAVPAVTPMRSVAVWQGNSSPALSFVPFSLPAQASPQQPLRTLSARHAHSYEGTLALPLAVPQVQVARQQSALSLPQVQTSAPLALGRSAAAGSVQASAPALVRHRAPGHIGGDAQGDPAGTSIWSQWLGEYWGTGATNLSGLEEWWNGKYGDSGYNPDIFTDFQKWATPMPDGVGVLFALMCLWLLYRNCKNRNFVKTGKL